MDLSNNPNKRPRPDTEATPPKPGKGKGQVTWTGWGMHAPAVDETVQALARLCLRQEEEISELRQEKGFVMHLSTGKFGLVRALLQSSMEWHRQRDLGTVDCNLRTCLFRLTLAELKGRLTKLQDTPPSLTEAIKAKWASDNPLVWLYQTWCPEKSCLQLNEASESRRVTQNLVSHGYSSPDRPDGSLPVQGLASPVRRNAGGDGCIQNLDCTSGPASSSSSQRLRPPRQLCGLATDRGQSPSRTATPISRSQRGQGIRVRQEHFRIWLMNPSGHNACYLNSMVLALIHISHLRQDIEDVLGRLGAINTAILQSRRPVLLRDMLTFQALLRSWRAPTRQHDIAEFYQHIVNTGDMNIAQFQWQAREQRGESVHILDRGDQGTPFHVDISFSRLVPGQPHTVQDCLDNHFRGQAALIALCSVAPFICTQLQRFIGAAHIQKDQRPIEWIGTELRVPVWQARDTLGTYDVVYILAAIVIHRGDTPYSGHYQACLLQDQRLFITDDGVAARPLRQTERTDVNKNSYLLPCVRSG